jgi:hypothetical protein
MDKNEQNYDLLKTEFILIQEQIDKYDGNMNKIKGFAIALWLGVVGWGIQSTEDYYLVLTCRT